MPRTEASAPTTSASITTEVVIWDRLAPRERKRASWWVRCPTTMENVLLMKKADTNRAMAANPSRMFWKASMKPSTLWPASSST